MINAKALVCDEKQRFSIQDVKLPCPKNDQIVINTAFSGVSVGTEFALIRNKLSWGPFPICTGYMGTGVVETVGPLVNNIKPGDKVYYRANENMKRADDDTAITSTAGVHCSHAVITPNTTHGAYLLPENAPMDAAAMFVMPAVGLYGVDMASPKMGETIVVHGCGLIGLGAVAACSHRGCVVIAVDIDKERLALARRFGADHVIDSSTSDLAKEIDKLSSGGADAVFECTGIPECVNPTIELCKTYGSYIWQGNYGANPLPFNFLSAHGRKLKMFFPCDDGLQSCRQAVLKNMTMGVLPWNDVISHTIAYDSAPEMFRRINEGAQDITGVVIQWN